MANKIQWAARFDVNAGRIITNQKLTQTQITTIYPYRSIMECLAFSRLKMVYEDHIINIRKYETGLYPITFEVWEKSK